MDYTLETAFCEDSTRQFIFDIEDRLINFLSNALEETLNFESMNSYQRMLVHLLAQHYQMQSRSLEDKTSKDSNLEESKSNDPPKSVQISKQKDSKGPLLKLRDYLTKAQLQKHDMSLKGGGIYRNAVNKEEPKSDEQVVLFKGRGKARWKPEDYDQYRFENDMDSSLRKREKEVDGYGKEEREQEYAVQEVKSISKVSEEKKEVSAQRPMRNNMLQRINNILADNKKPVREVKEENNGPTRSSEAPQKVTEQNGKDRDRERAEQNLSMKRGGDNIKKSDNFLPSTNHMLIVSEMIQGLGAGEVQSTIEKVSRVKVVSVRMYSDEKGILIFESESDTNKVMNYQGKFEEFKLNRVCAEEKQKFGDIFKKEYFNIMNLRPKGNKAVAIRMIHGHLKFNKCKSFCDFGLEQNFVQFCMIRRNRFGHTL